ncbi:MAG: exodeoxyribonuclease V subunit beta [Thermodesulfobacteriota bacterium]
MTSRPPEELDLLTAPLAGTHLIEASAGTGKTYAITGLYLRLVIEAGLGPEAILVVTFTEAATKELSGRIRQVLATFLAILDGAPASEPFLAGLLARLPGEEGRQQVAARLRLALRRLDLAAIHTIHGFCRRVLQEHAFESGALFETELADRDQELLAEIVDDFWRRESPGWGPALAAHLLGQGLSADSLTAAMAGILRALASSAGEGLRLPVPGPPRRREEEITAELARIWARERQPILDLLASPGLSQAKKDGLSADFRARLDQAMAQWLAAGPGHASPPVAELTRLTPAALSALVLKKAKTGPPAHPFFDRAAELVGGLQASVQELHRDLLSWCREELPARKRQQRLLSFQDLISIVAASLADPAQGPALAAAIRSRLPVALIDEFQDTDPLQSRIFQTLFDQPGASLFLIGDPKQAIYSFRGADVFAYLQAGQQVGGRRFSLGTNYRSSPAVVAAVNSLFRQHPVPFLLPGIDYAPVRPGPRAMPRLVIPNEEAALLFRTWPTTGNREATRRRVAAALAREVAALIRQGEEGLARFCEDGAPDRPLAARDLAILVRSHAQGDLVRRELARLGVRAVFHSRASVLATSEARELARLLAATLRPADSRLLGAALATVLLGWSAAELAALLADEARLEREIARFAGWQRLWQERGVGVLVHTVLRAPGTLARLAGLAGGERLIANFRHLAELLDVEASRRGLAPAEILAWLRGRCQQAGAARDEELLRLESDESLVHIVTVHRAKGLEYPVVFCPFLWDTAQAGSGPGGPAVCHDAHGRIVVDLGSPDLAAHQRQARREAFAEELRLCYVAVTRARLRLVLYWGDARTKNASAAAASPLGYLLLGPEADGQASDPLAALAARFPAGDDAALLAPVERLAAASAGAIAVRPLAPPAAAEAAPTDRPPPELAPARPLAPLPPPAGAIWSFTALAHGEAAGAERPDHDPLPAGTSGDQRAEPVERSLLTFPRGSRAGSCLHAILEELDFPAADQPALEAVVGRHLARFGFAAEWREPLAKALLEVLATPLAREEPSFCLRQIPAADRQAELEFYYPVPAASHSDLRRAFGGPGPPAGSPPRDLAFMKGYIDLVFRRQGRYYLADYKSNHLGDDPASYRPERLAEAMAEADYLLQARIYTLALHRHLALRLGPIYDYERHFGGVCYLFLRGMQPRLGPGAGVFFLRPAWSEIALWESRLAQGQEAWP